MMHSQFLLRVNLCVALGGALAVAQQQGITALRGARVHTAAGPAIDKGVVVMANGRIVAIGGADLEIPSGAKVVDCSGQVLTPGFVDASTTLGIAGNANEEGNEITAAVRVVDALDPASKSLRRVLEGGVTTIQVNPGNRNVIGGLGAVVRTHGDTVEKMLLRDEAGLRVTMGDEPSSGNRAIRGGLPDSMYYRRPTTRMGVVWETRQAFYKAKAYAEQKTLPNGQPPTPDADLEILSRVLKGEIVVHTTARAEHDIRTALRLAEEFGYKTILDEGTEAWRVIDELARTHTPVLLSAPSRNAAPDSADVRWATAQMLAQHDVPFAICTGADAGTLDLAREAMFAVRYGLDRDVALRAITSEAAKLCGVDDRVGSLSVGREADVVAWSGDPFDPTASVLSVWVQGEQVVSR
ncbi:MAG: amidohydrolase family protein [Planctomycetota bacterium]